ncbi:replication initiator [Nocardia sp. NBC_01009]|uniref:replication initiator n=1 Tax=Nocardia sp. NBC_01009 TaxID=2975996 RepID=UPI003866256C|nr:helitron helicase-like domain-containing protein [Nocardia sp. NBC_01009]
MTAPIIGIAPNRETAADRRAMPDINDIAESAAEKEGVCARVVPMRAFDPITSRTSYVGAPCKSTVASTCPACAKANRYLRMTQLREGWCAEHEPVDTKTEPTQAQQDVLGGRAILFADYHDARRDGDHELADAIKALVADLDVELRELGVRGRLPALDEKPRRKAKSTRRRDDLPDLPRKKVNKALTVGAAYANGKYRPSTFFTITLDSYGAINRVRDPETGKMVSDGSPRDPESYDYTRQARDTIHMAKLFSKWIENLRRAIGWNVQYFATVEPQKRGAPHLHIAIRGSIPSQLLYQVTAATYVNIWWPHFDTPVYTEANMPQWDYTAGTFVDPRTHKPLTYWDDALAVMDTVDDLEPAHTMKFGGQSKAVQILGGSEEMDTKVRYLTKYLTKSIGEVLDTDVVRTAVHYDRLHAELQHTPCSKTCAVWLRYGIVPKGANEKTQPGKCKGKAHRRDSLGLPGQRCLSSDKWSGKTIPDHKADRLDFVRAELARVGIVKPDTSHLRITPVGPGDKDAPPRSHLVMALVAARINDRAEYTNARLAMTQGPPGDARGAIVSQAFSTVQQAA